MTNELGDKKLNHNTTSSLKVPMSSEADGFQFERVIVDEGGWYVEVGLARGS